MNRRFATQPAAALSLCFTLIVACGDDPSRDSTSTSVTQASGVSTVPGTAGTASTGADTPTGSGTATPDTSTTGGPDDTTLGGTVGVDVSTTGGGAKFDLGSSDLGNTTGQPDTGCTKVDFLFVIDNSTSMEDNQKALIKSFPGFIAAIKTALGDVTDYHVMVTDTDAGGRCAQPCDPNDVDYVEFCAAADYYACTADLELCDVTRGAGIIEPVGSFASNKKCPFFGGHRYMVPEEPDLLGAFKCAAKVGTAGSSAERPMNAIEDAVSEKLNGRDGCNEGFLRDDAILVITFLSDDGNYVDKGKPADWKAAVVAAKNGDENAVVVAGLIPMPDKDCINKQSDDNTQGSHWAEFIGLWGAHGVAGSICEADYAPFFVEAVAAIDQTCEQFNPPG